MSYGFKIFDEYGNLTVDSTVFSYRFLGQYMVNFPPNSPAGAAQNITVPGCTPSSFISEGPNLGAFTTVANNGYVRVTNSRTLYNYGSDYYFRGYNT